MENRAPRRAPARRWLSRRIRTKGLRPRFAAYLIIAIWGVAVITFGVVEHLVDPETFPNIWLGMWWALETVTTVGFGDIVPAQTAGKVIASFLMLGGLSLLAVVTGVVTSVFVTQAQAEQRPPEDDQVGRKLDEVVQMLGSVKAELAHLRDDREG